MSSVSCKTDVGRSAFAVGNTYSVDTHIVKTASGALEARVTVGGVNADFSDPQPDVCNTHETFGTHDHYDRRHEEFAHRAAHFDDHYHIGGEPRAAIACALAFAATDPRFSPHLDAATACLPPAGTQVSRRYLKTRQRETRTLVGHAPYVESPLLKGDWRDTPKAAVVGAVVGAVCCLALLPLGCLLSRSKRSTKPKIE